MMARIVNRLDRIAFIHERSHSQAKFKVVIPKALKTSAEKARTVATFGSVAVKKLAARKGASLQRTECNPLRKDCTELKDKTLIEREGGKFWENCDGIMVNDGGSNSAHAMRIWQSHYSASRFELQARLFTFKPEPQS